MHTLVETPAGEARITTFPASGHRRATVVLSHGAGGGIEAPDLQALAAALPQEGFEVALVEQPWRVAGKRIAPAPKTLDLGWRAVLAHLTGIGTGTDSGRGTDSGERVPVIVGGRSAGARVACRTGLDTGAAGVLALAFPLHPPGKPEKSRIEELLHTGLPTLVVQGGADPFGGPQEFPDLPPGHQLVGLPAGGHEFAVRKGQPPVIDGIADAVIAWLETVPK
ncbi:MAG TPA: alpha/beta family hydrolase [Actinocrinis sp.]|nr:alpha/beta family hydrolase [Actinocrinis sp.]